MMENAAAMTEKERKIGLVFFLVQLFLLPGLLKAINGTWQLSSGTLNALFSLICFLSAAVIFRRFLGESVRRAVSHPLPVLKWAFLCLLGYYLAETVFAFGIGKLFPGFSNINDSHIAAENHGVFSAVAIILLTPITEEVLYRGLICDLTRGKTALTYCLSMAIFCAIHVMGYVGTYPAWQLILSFIQYLPAGFFLCFAYRRSGSLLAPMLMHVSINQIGMLLMR